MCPHSEATVSVASYGLAPALMRLLAQLPTIGRLELETLRTLGAAELAALSQGSSTLSSVSSLRVQGSVKPGFWGPELWAALPGLTELDVRGAKGVPGDGAFAQCCAAAARPLTIGVESAEEKTALQGALAGVPGCTVRAFSEDGGGGRGAESEGREGSGTDVESEGSEP